MNKIDEILKGKEALAASSTSEELGFAGKVGDVLMAPIRGIEGGLIRSPYNLVDDVGSWVKQKITGDEDADFLPDYEKNFTGESKTFVGKATQGLVEFASVFVPAAGIAGRVGKGTSALNKLVKGSDAVSDIVQTTGKVLSKGGIGTGAIADIVTYNKNNGTITDTFKSLGFESDITSFLETDEDSSALGGRLKSAIEGGLLGAGFNAVGELVTPLFKLMQKQRALNKAIKKGANESELKSILEMDNLTEGEKKTVSDWLAKTQKDAEDVKILLAKNKDLKESTTILKDMDIEVTDQHVLKIAQQNYENIVYTNNRLIDTFSQFKTVSNQENMGKLLDEMVRLTEVTSLQGKSLQALKGQAAARKASFESGETLTAMRNSVEQWKSKSPAEMAEFMEYVKRCDTPTELRQFLKGTLTKIPPTKLEKLGGVMQEFWKNSLLSGIGTHALNIGSNAFMLGYDKFKTFAVGMFKGDTLQMRSAVREFRSLFSNAFQSTRLAFRSFVSNWNKTTGKSLIDTGSNALVDTIQKGTLTSKWSKANLGSGTFGTAMEYLGYVVNTPMKFIGAMDDGFKTLAVRTKLEGQLFSDGITKGLDGEALETYIKTNLDKAINESGALVTRDTVFQDGLRAAREQGIEEAGKRMDFADNYVKNHYDEALGSKTTGLVDYARDMTFQQDLSGFSKSFQQFVSKNPLALGTLFPFVKTPMNVLRTAWNEFVPIQSTIDLVKSQIFNANPQVKAEAMARFAVSTTLMGSFLGLVNEGVLTGSGPTNAAERNNMMASGWQPYSIKFGDKYVSYSRLDPLATPLALVADVYEQYNRGLLDEADGDKFCNAITVSLMKMLQSKSYLQGAVSFGQMATNIGNPNVDSDVLMGKFLGSFVPSFLANQAGMIDGDDPMTVVRGLFDGIKARTGFDSTLEVRRNLLGEELKAISSRGEAVAKAVLPIRVSEQKNDRVLNEIAANGITTGAPAFKMSNVDLREIRLDDGRSAYSHYLDAVRDTKIKGKTMRQSIDSLIQSKRYQNLPEERSQEGVDSARASLIKSEISRYRERAKKEFLAKNKQINDRVQENTRLRKDVRKGEALVSSAIQSLLRK